MRKRIICVAPHPDDEILGCGGTLLRSKSEGAQVAWLIVTGISVENGWPIEQVRRRDEEINTVAGLVGFDCVYNLQLPTTQLDKVPINDLMKKFSDVFKSFQPEEVFLPHRSDVHTDHRVVFDVAVSCTKWFRYPTVRRVLAYETLSETDFGLNADTAFHPNYFVNIEGFLERKLEIMAVYRSEMSSFPFPRSVEALRAQALLRGAASGYKAAEAFQLLRERV